MNDEQRAQLIEVGAEAMALHDAWSTLTSDGEAVMDALGIEELPMARRVTYRFSISALERRPALPDQDGS